MNQLATQPAPSRSTIRWTTLRGLTPIIIFTLLAVLAEYLVVFYAMSIGVMDAAVLKIDWPVTISISPLFHLVPISAIVTLVSTWAYLRKKLTVKSQGLRKSGALVGRGTEPKKPKSGMSRRVGSFFSKIETSRVSIRSTITVLLTFLVLVLMISLLTYPQLIYRTVQSAYQNNPSMLNFVRSVDSSVAGFAEAVAPIGWIGTTINNGLLAAAPAVQNLGSGLGNSLASLAGLDNAGKYLVFQNAAAWISGVLILFYGEFMRKGYRYKKK